jgi:hypothetical protein
MQEPFPAPSAAHFRRARSGVVNAERGDVPGAERGERRS